MTASNLIVTNTAAHLLVDQAAIASDGTITAIRTKVAHSSVLRMAISTSGCVALDVRPRIKELLDRCQAQHEALRRLPPLVKELGNELTALTEEEDRLGVPSYRPPEGEAIGLNLFVALWSSIRRQPEGYIICSHPGSFPARVPTCELYPAREYISPIVEGAAPISGRFEPLRDGLRLLEAQRSVKDARGAFIVGGAAELATVDECGVHLRTLKVWPDRVGSLIRPRRRLPILERFFPRGR